MELSSVKHLRMYLIMKENEKNYMYLYKNRVVGYAFVVGDMFHLSCSDRCYL